MMSLDHMHRESFSPSNSSDCDQGGGWSMVNLGRNHLDYYVMMQGTSCSDVEVSYLKSFLPFRSEVVVVGVPSFCEVTDLS